MDADRWRRIETLFAEAGAMPVEARAAYLSDACAGDPTIRAEVASLLLAHVNGASFLEQTTPRGTDRQGLGAPPPLPAGARLGAFEIVAPIGSGGMGAVYHARDTRLGRSVGLKVLAPRSPLPEDGMGGFEREARAISRLAHPHICTLYDIARAPFPSDGEDDVEFLVMELVSGETLASVIARAALPCDLAVRYAIEIADALACAHGEGIVHRDLKPQNVMITSGGVKLLDFGLAAFTARALPHAPDQSGVARPRHIVGTPQYMAPEQIRGDEVDGRADLFSLGLILHEMLTGARAFERATTLETLHAVLTEDPPPLPDTVPTELSTVVARCLEKDREERVPTASALGVALRGATVVPHGGADAHRLPVPRGRRRAAVLLSIGFGVMAVGLAARWRPEPPPRISGYVQLTNDAQQKAGSLVTDGSTLYFAQLVDNEPVLARAPVGGGESVPIPAPFAKPGLDDISPDGSELFVGSYVGPGPFPYWTVPLRGGPPRPLGDLRARDVHPSPDGRQIAYVVASDVYLSGRDGSAARKLATIPNQYPGSAAWAPDGRRLRFSVFNPQTLESSIWEVGTDGTGLRSLLEGWNTPASECCGRWTPDGAHFIFQAKRNGMTSLWALSETSAGWRNRPRQPVQLTNGPLHFRTPTPSRDGRSIFAIGDQVRGEIMRHNAGSGEWSPLSLGQTVRSISELTYSPRGDRVVYVTYPEATLWCSRVDDTERRQLTFPPMEAAGASWSPDGERIVFQGRAAGGPWKLFVVRSAGGQVEQLVAGTGSEAAPDWSPDGQRIVFGGSPFFDPGIKGPTTLRVLDLGTRHVSEVPGSDGVWAARWSPDGRYLVAHRFDFSQLMLLDVATGRWEELARGVLHFANWSRDGQYVYFESWGEDTAAIRIRIRDRHREKLGLLKDFRRTVGPERCWSGLTPDNALLVLRDIGSQEIYALTLEAR